MSSFASRDGRARPATVPLWIIAGFLGSGKTTVLNHLLGEFAPRPVGVLLNDFGKIGVDARLIDEPAAAGPARGTEARGVEARGVEARETETRGAPYQLVEVNGGQIFCSCVSGSFVERLRELAAAPVEAILIEASGLAKPGALGPILDEVARGEDHGSGPGDRETAPPELRAGTEDGAGARGGSGRRSGAARLRYAGMVTVVDARTFEKLIHTVNAVAEQVVYADLLVINKCDAVDPARIHAVESAVRELNSSAAVRRTEFGGLPVETLPDAPTAALRRRGPRGERYAGWDGKKPVCRTWNPPASLSRAELLNELQRRMHTALRIKGFVETRDGPVFVSATPENVEMRPMERLDGSSGLTEFYPTAPKEENQ